MDITIIKHFTILSVVNLLFGAGLIPIIGRIWRKKCFLFSAIVVLFSFEKSQIRANVKIKYIEKCTILSKLGILNLGILAKLFPEIELRIKIIIIQVIDFQYLLKNNIIYLTKVKDSFLCFLAKFQDV